MSDCDWQGREREKRTGTCVGTKVRPNASNLRCALQQSERRFAGSSITPPLPGGSMAMYLASSWQYLRRTSRLSSTDSRFAYASL